MFENINKKPDRPNPLPGMVVSALILMVVSLTALYVYRTLFPEETVVDGISMLDEAAAERVDALCKSLPQPETFEQTIKGEPSDTPGSTIVYYQFRSPRSLAEVMPAFTLWFNENGWQPAADADSTYQKGSQKIYIATAAYYDEFTDYNIYCSEKK